MEQHDPNQPIKVPFWQWNLFVEYVDAMDGLFLAVEEVDDRGGLQRELQGIYRRVSAVIDYLDQGGPELEGPIEGSIESPIENPDQGAATTQNNPTSLAARETAFRSQAMYATKRYWCIYLSTGRANYYGTYAGAVARCYKLAAPANITCAGVKRGKCP